MSPDEHEREVLRQQLAGHLGDETAGLLMERLPPHRWDELATRADIGILRTDVDGLRTDVDGLRTDVDGLRTDVGELRTDVGELRTQMEGLRSEVVLRIEGLEHKLLAAFRGELTAAVTSQTRTMIFTMAGSLVSLAALSMTLGGA